MRKLHYTEKAYLIIGRALATFVLINFLTATILLIF
jgi:hypothetical protein